MHPVNGFSRRHRHRSTPGMLVWIELKSAPPTGAGTDPLPRARAGGSRKGDPWQNTRQRMRTIRNRSRFSQVAPARGRQSGPLLGRIRRSDPNRKLRIRRRWREWPRRPGGQRSSRGQGRPGGGWGGWQVGTAPTPGPARLCSSMGGLRGPRKNLQNCGRSECRSHICLETEKRINAPRKDQPQEKQQKREEYSRAAVSVPIYGVHGEILRPLAQWW